MEKHQPLTESIFYILLALRKPNHGYGIIQELEGLTNGRIVIERLKELVKHSELMKGQK